VGAAKQYALRWTATSRAASAFLFSISTAPTNWQEFRAALERYGGTGPEFVYADVDGNIGYQATGWLPNREKCAGDVPAEGPECEWAGRIPFDRLPSAYNPASGMVVTANQNPFPAEYPIE